MLSLAAVVPQPPLLVPQLTGTAAAETAPLRHACAAVAQRLAGCRTWIAVGTDSGVRAGVRAGVDPETTGSFVGFAGPVGRGVVVDLGGPTGRGTARTGEPAADLALPLLIAGWLAGLARADGHPVRVHGELVAPDTAPEDCAALGRELAARAAAAGHPVALLAVGDGAICHTERAPGHLDPRAAPFDETVAAALAAADPTALAALDADLADRLGAVGRAPWQVLAAACSSDRSAGSSRTPTRDPDDPRADAAPWRGELLYSAAPYGVGYHVAVWTPVAEWTADAAGTPAGVGTSDGSPR